LSEREALDVLNPLLLDVEVGSLILLRLVLKDFGNLVYLDFLP
jgi:hypothetical protein